MRGVRRARGPPGRHRPHPVDLHQRVSAARLAFDGQAVVTEVTGEEHAADHERALDHRVPLLDEYYTGYRQSVRRPDEIIRAIRSGASPAVWPMMRGRQRSRRTW